jgi:hypothetical protein
MRTLILLIGTCLGTLVYIRLVRGRDEVRLRAWKGMVVFLLLIAGAVKWLEMIWALLGKM